MRVSLRYCLGGLLAGALALGVSASAAAVAGRQAATPNRLIAFSRGAAPNSYGIWTVQANGRGLRRLTRSCLWDWEPAWSPDRTRVAFTRSCGGNFGIYVVNATGSRTVRRVTPRGISAMWPTWSPNGKRLAFVGGSNLNGDLYLVGANGRGLRRLTHNSVDDTCPAWRPDGSLILFTRASRPGGRHVLMVVSPKTGGMRSLGLGGGEPAWSPDGKSIAWARAVRRAASETDNIWIARANGSGAHRLTRERVGVASHHPSWSSDGRTIVFMSNRGALMKGSALYVARVDGSGIRRLAPPVYEDADPDWQLP